MSGRCGTPAGYAAHRDNNQPTCTPCRAANNRATKRYRVGLELGTPATNLTDATGTIRRLQALSVAGWTQYSIWREAGMPSRPLRNIMQLQRIDAAIANRITQVTEQLWNQPPPAATPAERAAATLVRGIARREGWAPLAAWDDIDNPADRPQGVLRKAAA